MCLPWEEAQRAGRVRRRARDKKGVLRSGGAVAASGHRVALKTRSLIRVTRVLPSKGTRRDQNVNKWGVGGHDQ